MKTIRTIYWPGEKVVRENSRTFSPLRIKQNDHQTNELKISAGLA